MPASSRAGGVWASRVLRIVALTLACASVCGVAATSAVAAAPWWHVNVRVAPSSLVIGSQAHLGVQTLNIGDAAAGPTSLIRAKLPSGLGVAKVQFFTFALGRDHVDFGPEGELAELHLCEVAAHEVTCHLPEFIERIHPYEELELRITANVEAGASSGELVVGEAGGGEARSVQGSRAINVSNAPPAFGVESLEVLPEREGGDLDVQAGSHPYQLTTSLNFNQGSDYRLPPASPRDLEIALPAGLIGNAEGIPKCSNVDFQHLGQGGFINACPANTAVGVSMATIEEANGLEFTNLPVPVFNLEPEPGEPARFGFEVAGSPVTFDTAVRTGSDYGVNVSIHNITQLANIVASTTVFWGAPSDISHNNARGWGCIAGENFGEEAGQPCIPSTDSNPKPFLTMPTACGGAFGISVSGDSWPTKPGGTGALPLPPAAYALKDRFGRELQLTGCDQLTFAPTLELAPTQREASTPSGVTAKLRMPQEVNEDASGLASSNIKDTTVTLPAGLALNAASAGGLDACSESQIGFTGVAGDGTAQFTPTLPQEFCPDAAKVGTVRFKTPVLAHELEGSVYLASQNANPFGTLVAIYVVAEDRESGVLLKFAGEVQLGEDGRIVTSFKNLPQAPLEEAVFSFFGGSRAPLVTPSHCGTYETSASFGPWSGNGAVESKSTFQITRGPHGTPCPSSLPFAPAVTGGTGNPQAAAFAPFSTTIARADGDQEIGSLQLRTPPGFAAMISSVQPCGEEQADHGTCGAASLIGHASVGVGVGNEPFTVSGQVFLTGPYKGAPFGLSIVTPAKAGPFDLGLVIVRAKLDIDPRTAQAIVTTDSTPPYSIPHILKGIPLEIKRAEVVIDRAGFAFNPTSCRQLSITGSITSSEGAIAPVSVPFEAANCATLHFAPKFSVSTVGRPTKAKGVGLAVKLSFPKAAQGTQANVARVKVVLPKQLPSRLTTLQQACLAKVFETNPAGCPAGSIIGHVKVTTPVLPVPVSGPVYFVSHGGEAFPSLTMVLQGDNVTVNVVGATLIRKGITSTTFNTVPDLPFTQMDLTLPQGRYSAVTAFGNLCASKLVMPTAFYGQNGAEIHQNTTIKTAGCKKPKHRKHHKRK